MTYLYKLGDGPINYDWNHRYAWLDGSELFYSPSLDDAEKKTLNIYGAAVSNICKIKNKDYAFGILLNPPTYKIIYFAFDDLEEAQNFRDKVLAATLNPIYDDAVAINEFGNYENKNNNNNLVSSSNAYNNINKVSNNSSIANIGGIQAKVPLLNIENKNKNNNEKLFNIGFNIKRRKNSNEFYQNLESLRKDYIIDDSKQIKKFARGLKISVPLEWAYANFYQNIFLKTIRSIMLLVTLISCMLYIESYFIKSLLISLSLIFALHKKKNFLISFLKKKILNKKLKKCNYIAKATTIIDCDANKIYNILSDLKLRREWDNFIRKPEHIATKCSNCSCGDEFNVSFSIPENHFISSIANSIQYDVEVIKHMDDDENCYIIYKNKSEKLNFFESEFLEIFLLIPLKDYETTKTLVIFLTNIDFLNDKNHLDFDFSEILNLNFKNFILPNSFLIPYFFAQKLKEERLMILANLKEFIINFNSFEVDSVISQIPHIRNLELSKLNTKSENDLRKHYNQYNSSNSNNTNIVNGNDVIINANSLLQENNHYSNGLSSTSFHNLNNINFINSQDEIYASSLNSANHINKYDKSEYLSNRENNSEYKNIKGIQLNTSLFNPGINNMNTKANCSKNNPNNSSHSLSTFGNNNAYAKNVNHTYISSFYNNNNPHDLINQSNNILIDNNNNANNFSFNNNTGNNNNFFINKPSSSHNSNATNGEFINNQEIFYDACSEVSPGAPLISNKPSFVEINNNLPLLNFSYNISNSYHKLPVNPDSILTNGKRIPLNERLKNYVRYREGGVECRNLEEIRAQDGLFLELMKRAGKQLLEGKNIVGVSLPVKIFEPRSTLTRLTDLWGTAYEYINKASECFNPVERMKIIITMAISGIHLNAKQLKPFNPILGETLEGFWPDNSQIYMEHMSHHPPISRFLILGANKKWKFYGYYEYAVKIKSITGNVAGGQFKGPNILEIYNKQTGNNDIIEYTLPSMNISGLMYGKRIVEWEGVCEFKDENNGVYAFLKFTPAPKFYQKFVEPTDIFRGEITQNDEVVHKIYGSPLEKIMFDDEVFWELEKCDIIRPMDPPKCLPSDCRFREDMIALAQGKIELADKEKVRLEVIQRADRALRQKFAKKYK